MDDEFSGEMISFFYIFKAIYLTILQLDEVPHYISVTNRVMTQHDVLQAVNFDLFNKIRFGPGVENCCTFTN